MKTMEKLVLDHPRKQTTITMDPLQLAYWPLEVVEDAGTFLQHKTISHLENYVRIM